MRGVLVLLTGSAALACQACEPARSADPRTLPPLVAVEPAAAAAAAAQAYTGVVRARVESDLGFRVGGKVAERLVNAGEAVRRGQPLMRLDPADLALAAQAQAAAAEAAQARSVQANADLARLQGMVAAGSISAQGYDQAKAAADSARADLAAARAQARLAADSRAYAVLIADADGVAQETLAEPGQVVSAGQVVVRLARAGPREADVGLPETVRPPLGAKGEARLYGGPPTPAHLRQLAQAADPATRTYDARFVLEGPGAAAPLGATVTVSLGADPAPTAARAPLGALYDPGAGPGVWRVQAGRVWFLPVKILALQEETAVVAGVAPGTPIVAMGADHLRQGERVRPAEPPGTAAERGLR